MKTLIVGNESVDLLPLEKALRSRHHELFFLERTTLEDQLSHPAYALIFLALPHPLEGATQLCRSLKHLFSNALIILLVEKINEETLQEFLNVGIHDFFLLPSSHREFNLRLSVIEKQIENNTEKIVKARMANGFRTAALQQFPYIVSHHLRQTLIQIKKQLNELLIQPRTIPLDAKNKSLSGTAFRTNSINAPINR